MAVAKKQDQARAEERKAEFSEAMKGYSQTFQINDALQHSLRTEPMNDFNTLFPNFASQCAALNRVLLAIAFVLLVIGIVSSTVTGQRSPGAYLRTFGRTFALH